MALNDSQYDSRPVDELPVNDKVIVGLFEIESQHLCNKTIPVLIIMPNMTKQSLTMSTQFQIDGIPSANINDTQKALIPSFKLALVKDLYCDHRRLGDISGIARRV